MESTVVEEFRKQEHLDHGSVEAEWEVIENLLERYPDQKDALHEYVFCHYRGYVDNRVRAGWAVFQAQPAEGWQMLENLVRRSDPDDRDTALQILVRLNDDHAQQLALMLIEDEYPYIALDAIDFIQSRHPLEAKTGLEKLLRHSDQWVVAAARDRLTCL